MFDPNASQPVGSYYHCPKGFLPNSGIVKSELRHRRIGATARTYGLNQLRMVRSTFLYHLMAI